MARDKASKAASKPIRSNIPEGTAPKIDIKGKSKSTGISDELRQAVTDLGGDEEDIALIAGVDDDVEGTYTASGPGAMGNEKDIRKALGEFMKGLDFKAARAEMPAEEEEEEDEVDGEDDEEEEEEDEREEETAVQPTKLRPELKKPEPTPAKTPISSVDTATSSDPSPNSATLVPSTPLWSTLLPPLPPSPIEPLPPFKLQGLRSRAENMLTSLPPLNRKSSSADAAFISQVLNSGTHQDKLAALTLLVRESPIHAVKELGRLRGMTGYKDDTADAREGRVGAGSGGNKDQRVAVCKALVDWWVSGGGKASGKLRYFADQPQLSHPHLTDRHLLVFAFEDFLKRWFFNLLQVLEVLAHDHLVYIRTQALQMIFRLLQGNAEQEQNLLRLGANKLGDTDKSVASKTSHLLLTLLQVHPAMKSIVAREVSALVLKPSAPVSTAPSSHVRFDDAPSKPNRAKSSGPERNEGQSHARYYGLITLNQITLSRGDQELAGRLVDLYFEIFREILGEESGKEEDGEEGIEKVVGKVGKWEGRRKKAGRNGKGKSKGKDGGGGGGGEEDMEGGDARLIAAVLTGINRAVPYAKLDDAVFTGYMKSLFRITHLGTFNTSIQSLSLIFQVTQSAQSSPSSSEPSSSSSHQTQNSVTDRFYRTLYDSLFDPRLLSSSKQAMYLNLLFRALKADKEIKRVMAFVKRLCQMFGLAGVPFLSGALYLLGELFNTTPGLKRMLIEPEDDGEERFVDAPEAGEAVKAVEAKVNENANDGYDGKKREPLYAKAESSCLWEILPLTQHFHPSISLLSTQLLSSLPLTGSPDIGQNTLISFLDKFVYRNPKKNVAQKGASVMQPAAAMAGNGVKLQKGSIRGTVNEEGFWRKKAEDVPADQLFFHKFFSAKLAKKDAENRRKKAKEPKSDEEELESGDDEEAGSELDEDEVWKAMQASMPGAEELNISDSEDGEGDEDVDYSSDEEEEKGEAEEEEESGEELEDPEMEESDEEVDIDDISDEDDEDEDEDEEEEDGDEDGFPDLDSEEEDLIPLDEMPDIPLNASISPSPEPEMEMQQSEELGGKRKRPTSNQQRKEMRKKRKELPLFGDYEAWQKVIEEGGNEGED